MEGWGKEMLPRYSSQSPLRKRANTLQPTSKSPVPLSQPLSHDTPFAELSSLGESELECGHASRFNLSSSDECNSLHLRQPLRAVRFQHGEPVESAGWSGQFGVQSGLSSTLLPAASLTNQSGGIKTRS